MLRWFYLAPIYGVFGGVALRLALSFLLVCGFDSFSLVLVVTLVSVRQWVIRPAFSLVGVFLENEFYAVRSLYMWVRFNRCKRSRGVGFEDGILRVCFLNECIVTWTLTLVPSGVLLFCLVFLDWFVLWFFEPVCVGRASEAAGSIASKFEGVYLSARGNCFLLSDLSISLGFCPIRCLAGC